MGQPALQGGGADLEHRAGVAEHLGGGGEQPDAGVVAPPAGLVVELLGGERARRPARAPGDGVLAAAGART